MFHPRIFSCFLLLAFGCNTISNATSSDHPAFEPGDAAPISSKVSLVHLGSIDSFTITEQGTLAGRLLLNALEKKDPTEAAAAKVIYHAIVPKEHYGGEYTALEWFCDYLIGTDDDRRAQLANRFHRSFFDFFAENEYANLEEYLARKYKLKKFADSGTDDGRDRLSFLEDFILFNNPRREEWERTSKIIECLKIQPGTTIADVGSGPGYYSFKFAELTGASGKVYAIDTVQNHLDYVQNVCRQFGISNLETIKDRADGISLNPDTADLVFMCSLYHIIYTTSTEEVKDRFVASLKDALKPDGRLVIVDNAVVQDGQLPYHGPHIAKELVIGQLYYYGFDLTEQHQFIPQRYVLIFKKRT